MLEGRRVHALSPVLVPIIINVILLEGIGGLKDIECFMIKAVQGSNLTRSYSTAKSSPLINYLSKGNDF